MQAANWVAVKTTGTLKPPLQMCTLDHLALLHKCKRSETLAPIHLFILCWTLTMTTRLLQNVVKLLQSKIGAKLLQEGAYWRGASTSCTKVGVHCTQVHTVAHWHEIAQKHETKVHNALGAPPSIQPHASALPPDKKRNKKKKLESSAFSTKLLTTKASSLPLINLLKSSPLEMAVLDRLRLMHTRRWKEPWLFAKPNDDESRSGRLAFATRSPNTAVFAVLRQKRDFWNLRKAKVGQTPAWGP